MNPKDANKELEKILLELAYINLPLMPDPKRLDNTIKKALKAINSLMISKAEVLGAIPQNKTFTYSDIYGDDPRNNYGYGEERYRDGTTNGYGKAIEDFKLNLKPLLEKQDE